MSAKKSLKAAKGALEANDPESALEYSKEALEYDSDSYYAYVFLGKAHHLLKQFNDAVSSYKKAIEIEGDALVAWKGLFLLVRSYNDFDLFFRVSGDYLGVLLDQGISLSETIRDVQIYLKQNNMNSNDELKELYLRNIVPGSKLGDVCGEMFQRPDISVRQLLEMLLPKEKEVVTRNVSREKMKYSSNATDDQKTKIDMVAWSVYAHSEIPALYQTLINITDTDSDRRQYEEEFLIYKYNLLKVAPLAEKGLLQEELKEMVNGMVLIKHSSLLCWTLYFDWQDVKEFSELDEKNVYTFIKMFGGEGLAALLYGFIMSDISPFDKKNFLESIDKKENKDKKRSKLPDKMLETDLLTHSSEEEAILASVKEDEEEANNINFSPDEVLSLMVEGFESSKESIFANRLIVAYYLHIKEYAIALDRCRQAIGLLASIQRTTSMNLENTKEDFLLSLAIVYTYFEAPKNFPKASQIYDSVLRGNANNVKARVGKSLILIEKNDLNEARALLELVVKEYPEDHQALLEYSWCQVRLGDIEEGRSGLLKVLHDVKGGDLNSAELRALIYYRIGLSYTAKGSEASPQDSYKNLVLSLKESANFGPSYTALGLLYRDAFNDEDRAIKCFYKAFELDANEVVSGKCLVEDFASKDEWEMVEILSKRIVTNEQSRRTLQQAEDKSWPYRMLGCCALNQQDDPKAVEWYQSALRLDASDLESWIGLGESYFNCGRLEASVKVFTHSLDIDDSNWSARYMLGVAFSRIGSFDEGEQILSRLLESRPNEECVITALYESLLAHANNHIKGGFFGRAVECTLKVIELIETAVGINKSSHKIWECLSHAIHIFLTIQDNLSKLPYQSITQIVSKGLEGEVSDDETITIAQANEKFDNGDIQEASLILLILCQRSAMNILPSKTPKALRSAKWYNLGLAYLEAFTQLPTNVIYRDSAIKSFRSAIKLESNNASYWSSLGNAYVSSNPRISQHCFIKAASLDQRDSSIWNNLAALYLRYGDYDLAQEAFMRAQSIAPDQSPAWLGNAMAAEAKGDFETASRLFAHAFVLSNGRSPIAQVLFALSVINKRVGKGADIRDIEASQELSIANFAMKTYLRFYPNDETGLNIAMIVAERCNNLEMGIQYGEKLNEILEHRYEESEDESILVEFAKVKSQLSRLYLGMEDYEKAIEYAQFALDIVEGEDAAHESIVLSSRVVIGLCFFFNNQFDDALTQLKIILEGSSQSKRIVVLISQILYAFDQEETKQAALDQLFADIETRGSSLLIALTIGAISVVENLADYLPIIKEELESLSLEELIGDSFRSVPLLLDEINDRIERPNNVIWQRNAILFPDDYNVWKRINKNISLSIASLNSTKTTSSTLAESYISQGKLRHIQRGIMLDPTNIKGYDALRGFL